MLFNRQKQAEPVNLKRANELRIDCNTDTFGELQTVCMGFNKTIAYLFDEDASTEVRSAWKSQAIELETDNPSPLFVIPRPGAGELLRRLSEKAHPILYSRCDSEILDKALLALSIAEGDPSDMSDPLIEERAWSWMSTPVWAKEQCVKTDEGYEKSLGHLCAHAELQINYTWLVDHQIEGVDFPSRVIEVPQFLGSPNDRCLFHLMDTIFYD